MSDESTVVDPTPVPQIDAVEINGVKGIKRGDLVSAVVAIDNIVPMAWNPNQMNEKKYQRLKKTIQEDGFLDAVNVIPCSDGKTFALSGGEHRWRAAKELGLAEIPCDIMVDPKWQDEENQVFQNARFNVIHGEMNPEKFMLLFQRAAEKHGTEKVVDGMGYDSQTAINKIVKQVAKSMKDSLPPEMAKQFEEQAKEARTVGDLERIIQHMFQEHGDSIKYSFMVFTWAGKEHVYVAMNKDVHDAMKKIMGAASGGKVDINELLGEAIKGVADKLPKPKGKKAEQTESS